MKYIRHCTVLLALLLPAAAPVVADSSKPTEQTRSLVEDKKQGEQLPISKGKFMFSVTLHRQKEIQSLLDRADQLSRSMRTQGNQSRIALILHGPEIRFFTTPNYERNKNIVDRAARLDGDEVIEIKVCKTKMDELGIKEKDIPAFVEIIPYAPEEEKKLLKQGYVYL